jgi:hypothetical protein
VADPTTKPEPEDVWTCAVCGGERLFQWCDYHGVAQHSPCGAPYRLYHYENEKRISKPPELLIKAEFVGRVQRYWNETRRVMPGGHSFGHHGENGAQEMATSEDAEAFYAWLEAEEQGAARKAGR